MLRFYCVLVLSIFIIQCKSNEDENCVWTYRCCKFKDINNQVKCEKMCEAVINCVTSTTINSYDEIETFNETAIGEQFQPFIFPFRRMPKRKCPDGYRYVNDKCRRVLNRPLQEDEKINEN